MSRQEPDAPTPPHHRPGGGFRDPGLRDARAGDLLRWRWERFRKDLPPDPDPGDVPRERPDPAAAARPGELRMTWIGHATVLVQWRGLDLLTDPMFGRRASPVTFVGPERFLPPGLPLEALPRPDAVLLTHDHYDHLDRGSVKALVERFGPGVPWITPLGYREWLGRRGVETVRELDWWEETRLEGPRGAARVVLCPARHWSRRGLAMNERLWGSFAVVPGEGERGGREGCGGREGEDAARGPSGVLFVGDSGYFEGFREIGERLGPFEASLLPVGAYEPRWFMAPVHMNPAEAVDAYLDLGGEGVMMGLHWGTFRLTDEDPLEPPRRTRAAWDAAGLPPERLLLPGIGGTAGPFPSPPVSG